MSDKYTGMRLGSVEFSGFGGFPEKMTTALIEAGVPVRRLRFGDGTVSGIVSPADYWALSRAARKYGIRLRAGKRRGLYFTLLRYSRRAGLYVGGLAFIMLLALAGSRVQNIEIISSSGVTASQRGQIMNILEECGISEGRSSRGLDTTAAERRIMLEIPEAAWVDITCVGYRVEASVEMGTPKPELLPSDAPCNIVATRAATIVDHTVRAGTLTAEIGSGVARGGLLVSGIVTDQAENLFYKHASADIIGEFTELQEFYVPYQETIEIPDGEKTEFAWLVYQDDEYPLFFGSPDVPGALYAEETEPLRLFGQDIPLFIKRGVYTAYREAEITRSADDCLAEIARQQADFEENFYGEYEIVSCQKTAVPEESGIRLTAEYTLRGNIAAEQEIILG